MAPQPLVHHTPLSTTPHHVTTPKTILQMIGPKETTLSSFLECCLCYHFTHTTPTHPFTHQCRSLTTDLPLLHCTVPCNVSLISVSVPCLATEPKVAGPEMSPCQRPMQFFTVPLRLCSSRGHQPVVCCGGVEDLCGGF